jgi:hypothetical protein
LQSVPGSAPHVKVLDFGLAKFTTPETQDNAVTRAGEVFGTPSYMAPEQVSGGATDRTTDLYSLGILLFEMLSGQPPFHGNMTVVMHSHLVNALPKLEEIHPGRVASDDLDALLRRATAKKREERFQSADEFSAAVDALPRPIVRELDDVDASLSGRTTTIRDDEVRLVAKHLPRSPWRGLARWTALALACGGLAAAYVRFDEGTRTWASMERIFEDALFEGGDEVPAIDDETPGKGRDLAHAASIKPSAEYASSPLPSSREADSPEGAPTSTTEATSATTAPATERRERIAPSPPRIDAEELWAEVPKLLKASLDAVNKGMPLSRRTLAYVHQYNRDNLGDPRGHLVLARSHLNNGFRKNALNEYAAAIKLNPDVRVDPRMLDDLLKLVSQGSRPAADLVRDAYGREALEALDGSLARTGVNRSAQGHLQRLRGELME